MNKQTENRLGGELRSQHTAARLLEELENGRYSGAAQLPSELELASDLGVSRTVVRDALSELERDGYLERVPPVPTSAHTINFFSNKHTTVFRTLQNFFRTRTA